jgi:prepilin-type N-terminal cleavage/methylation domain-containing protein
VRHCGHCVLGRSAPRPLGVCRPGFTLIEILVVISIITVLVGISIPVALKMLGAADRSTTRSLLNGLAGAADDYNVVTNATVPHFGNDAFGKPVGSPIGLNVGDDVTDGNDEDYTFGYFVKTAGQVPTTAKLLAIAAKEDLRNLTDDTPIADVAAAANNPALGIDDIALLDGWDNKVRYAGGVNHNDAFSDDDYLPAHPTAFFASAGPDGLWGSVLDDNSPDPAFDDNGDGEPDAADNVYSFDLDGLQ